MRPTRILLNLCDFSFSEYITPRIIGRLYAVCIILAVVNGVATARTLGGPMGVIFGIVTFLLIVVVARVACETIRAVFEAAANRKDPK